MRIITELKEILYHKGLSLKFVAEELSKKLDKPYSLANLSNKLKRGSLRYIDMQRICEVLGYYIDIKQHRIDR